MELFLYTFSEQSQKYEILLKNINFNVNENIDIRTV
jgi:hypothetical protein